MRMVRLELGELICIDAVGLVDRAGAEPITQNVMKTLSATGYLQ